MNEVLARLERWLGRHRPDVLAALGPPASDDDIARLRTGLRRNGFPDRAAIPEDVEAFLRWHAGLVRDCDIAATWFFSRRDPMRIDWMIESHQIMVRHGKDAGAGQPGFYHPAWIGILDNSYSILAVDAVGTLGHERGQVVYVDFKGGPSRRIIAPSLSAWLRFFLAVLEHPVGGRYYRQIEADRKDELWDATYDLELALLPDRCPGYPIERTVFDPAE